MMGYPEGTKSKKVAQPADLERLREVCHEKQT